MATLIAPNGTTTATQRVAPPREISPESGWSTLYRLAGGAALTVVGLVAIGVIVFFLRPRRAPSPA